MLRVTSSRRAAGLKPTDYDHEISLEDHDAVRTPPEPQTPEACDMTRSSTRSRLLSPNGDDQRRTPSPAPREDEEQTQDGQETLNGRVREDGEPPSNTTARPSIAVQGKIWQLWARSLNHAWSNRLTAATPGVTQENNHQVKPKKSHVERESAIDILYQNERGGFLCGIALFSGQALGGLDPPAWSEYFL